MAARALLCQRLAAANHNDCEGADQIDLEAQSHNEWVAWKKSLNEQDAQYLNIWRAGAVSTNTRRHFRANAPQQLSA
eukprot:6945412-Karenia_brevis.AAC.1